MDWLNYHHLLYFWTVAQEGSVARACERLGLAQPTISGQIHELENDLGVKLFQRVGRGLVLTDTGKVVYRYADEIFSIGRELTQTLKGRPRNRPMRLVVGIADVLPKLVVARVLRPLLSLAEPVQLVCVEEKTDRLLAELALFELDVVLADSPVGSNAKVKAYSHLLGECPLAWFARPDLAAQFRPGFPRTLHGAPMLLPLDTTMMRRDIEQWLQERQVVPDVRGEFADSALMKIFGADGMGLFPGPAVLQKQICEQHGVEMVGLADGLRQQFYAISVERRLKHPAVVALVESARRELFE